MKKEKDPPIKLNKSEVEILNSKVGLKQLFSKDDLDIDKALEQSKFELTLREFQAEMVDIQNWVKRQKKKIIVIFEGRDNSGKGGTIKRITAHINPRQYKIVALPKPSEEEQGQWFFQRYVKELPRKGEIVFFDRSWYNRAIVEPVNGFCTTKEYDIFMSQVNDFESMILDSDIILIKIYLRISKKEQAKRLAEINSNPLKKWQLTEVDARAQKLWNKTSKYEKHMFEITHTEKAPWKIINAEKMSEAVLGSLEYILKQVPYLS